MAGVVSVAHVQPHHTHAGVSQAEERLPIAGGGADGGNNLGLPARKQAVRQASGECGSEGGRQARSAG